MWLALTQDKHKVSAQQKKSTTTKKSALIHCFCFCWRRKHCVFFSSSVRFHLSCTYISIRFPFETATANTRKKEVNQKPSRHTSCILTLKIQSNTFILSLSFCTVQWMSVCLCFFSTSCILIVIVHCLPYFVDAMYFRVVLAVFLCHQNKARRKKTCTHTHVQRFHSFSNNYRSIVALVVFFCVIAVVLTIFPICLLSMLHEYEYMESGNQIRSAVWSFFFLFP